MSAWVSTPPLAGNAIGLWSAGGHLINFLFATWLEVRAPVPHTSLPRLTALVERRQQRLGKPLSQPQLFSVPVNVDALLHSPLLRIVPSRPACAYLLSDPSAA